MKRYSIMVRYPGQDKEVELASVDTHPEAIPDGAKAKTRTIFKSGIDTRRTVVPFYENVRIVDHQGEKE
jgi:hypothetical protein